MGRSRTAATSPRPSRLGISRSVRRRSQGDSLQDLERCFSIGDRDDLDVHVAELFGHPPPHRGAIIRMNDGLAHCPLSNVRRPMSCGPEPAPLSQAFFVCPGSPLTTREEIDQRISDSTSLTLCVHRSYTHSLSLSCALKSIRSRFLRSLPIASKDSDSRTSSSCGMILWP